MRLISQFRKRLRPVPSDDPLYQQDLKQLPEVTGMVCNIHIRPTTVWIEIDGQEVIEVWFRSRGQRRRFWREFDHGEFVTFRTRSVAGRTEVVIWSRAARPDRISN